MKLAIMLVLLAASVFAAGENVTITDVHSGQLGHSIADTDLSGMKMPGSLSDGAHGSESANGAHGAGPIDTTASLVAGALAFLLIAGLVLFFRSLRGKDLLEYKLVNVLSKSNWYPRIIQMPTLIFFFFIIYYFFFGAAKFAENPGSILAWTLWWPIIPLVFIMLGRIWCTACPIPIISDFLQKFVQPTRKAGPFIMKYGIWVTDGLFIAITLFDRLYGMVDTPWLSGLVFILLISGAVSLSLRYERRTFCKYFCFLGGVSGNYSMLSGFTLESKDKALCASCPIKACYFGSGKTDGCPYSNVMPAKQGMRNCTLCMNCVKACPKNNIALRMRPIASELWSHAKVSFSESFFAKLMVGVVIIQNLGMLAVWGGLIDTLGAWGLSEKPAIIVLYFTAITIPLILMTITSYLSSKLSANKHSLIENFAAFGYAFIPIDVAGHLAHNLFHLLEEGKAIFAAFIGLFTGRIAFGGALASASTIKGLQFALIIAGGLGTLYAAFRIAKQKEGTTLGAIKTVAPHMALLLLVFAVNIYLFMSSMEHRGG